MLNVVKVQESNMQMNVKLNNLSTNSTSSRLS